MDIKGKAQTVSRKYNIDSRVIELALKRGITEDMLDAFLYPEKQEIAGPEQLEGIIPAVNRIARAVRENQKIVIYGDYDADGITSTAILVKALKRVTPHINYYIPERDAEGYGLNEKALSFLLSDNTDLVITVDCGIKSTDIIKKFQELGMEFIVTDHHTPGTILPEAIIVNPKVKAPQEFAELAGVGVAYLLAKGLSSVFPEIAEIDDQLLQLAAIGTIADLVVLDFQNRMIVRKGLAKLNQNPVPGIKKLLQLCDQEQIDSKTVAFLIAPIINSSGRMESPEKALRLLLSEDSSELEELSKELLLINEDRKKLVEIIYKEAKKMILEKQYFMDPVIIAEKNDWKPGVLGIVASRLVSDYQRPVILLSEHEDGLYKGSARSIAGFNLYQALENQTELLFTFGGHAQAAGLAVYKKYIKKLRRNMNQDAYLLMDQEHFEKVIQPDLEFESPDDITMNFFKDLTCLEPFGNGNPEPVFSFTEPVTMTVTKIGKLKNHLRADIISGAKKIRGVYFNYKEYCQGTFESNLYFGIGVNDYMNRKSLQLEIKKITDAEGTKDIKREEQVYSEILFSKEAVSKNFTFSEKMEYNNLYKLIHQGQSLIYSDNQKQLFSDYPFLKEFDLEKFESQRQFSDNFLSVKKYIANSGKTIIVSDAMVLSPEILNKTSHYFFHTLPRYPEMIHAIKLKFPFVRIEFLADFLNHNQNGSRLSRDILSHIYKYLQNKQSDQTVFLELNSVINDLGSQLKVLPDEKMLVTALLIFQELDFLEYCIEGDILAVTFNKHIQKTKLEKSRLYQSISG